MWFNLIMFFAFVAVWYFQFLQGAYSALIMSILTVISVCVTFDAYEWVATMLNFDFVAGYHYGMAFLLTFAAVLAVLRTAFDTFAPANMYFTVWVDRPIAGVFGLFVGLVMSGMLAIGFQMLPFGPDILGFDRVGILSQPLEVEQKQSITDNKFTRNISKAMEFTSEYSKGLQRRMWFNQDEIAFGIYRRLLLDNNMLASDKKAPKDHFGQDIDSNEFLARCWDWRIQARFAVTPVALRVPLWAVEEREKGEYSTTDATEKAPMICVKAVKLTKAAYDKIGAGSENPANNHILISAQIPHGAGVKGWYMAPAAKGGIRKGNFPQVVPAALARTFAAEGDDDPDEFASFAFWQVKLLAYNAKNETKEFPLRAVFGLSVSEKVPEPGSDPAKKRTKLVARKEFLNEIGNTNQDNVASGNISVLTFPRDDVLQFRLLFFVEKQYDKKVQLVYTRIPPDPKLLADANYRAERLEFRSPSQGMGLNSLNNPLIDDDVVKLK